MSGSVEIIEYKDEFKESCIELLDQALPTENNAEAFNWRFEDRGKNKPIIACALDNNKVVSFISWIPWSFQYEDKIYVGYQAGKAATDVNYRRKGIFSKLVVKGEFLGKERGIDFMFSFFGSTSYGAFIKNNYYPIGIYNYYIRLLNPLKKKDLEVNKNNNYEVIDFHSIVDRHKISPICDSDYFQWRYIKNQKHYNFVFYEETNNKALFIVRENIKRKYFLTINELLILDCLFSSFNQLFIEHAIQYLSRMYASKVHYIKTFFNPNSDRGRALKRLFHVKRTASYQILMIKPISGEFNDTAFLNCNNWDIFPHLHDSS